MRKRVVLLLAVLAVSLCSNVFLFWIFEHGPNPHVNNLFDVFWWWGAWSLRRGFSFGLICV